MFLDDELDLTRETTTQQPSMAGAARTCRSKVLKRAVVKAAGNPATMAAAAAIAGTALLLGSGLLGMLALLGYVLAVAFDLGRPARWREAIKHVRSEPPSLPPATLFMTDAARDLLLRLERARCDRISTLQSLPGPTQESCETLLHRAGALEEAATRILPVLDRICRHLGADPTGPLRLEVLRVERAAATAAAESIRADYEHTLSVLGERVRVLERGEQLRALLLARLEVILSELEALGPGLLALDLQQSAAAVLDNLPAGDGPMQELQTMEEAVASVLPPAPVRPAAPAPVSALCWAGSPVCNL
jgi:hypothetical protein